MKPVPEEKPCPCQQKIARYQNLPVLFGLFFGLILISCIFLLLAFAGKLKAEQRAQNAQGALRRTIVLDAGHGGFDGGAVAPDGMEEASLNLAFCRTLKPMLESYGFRVVLTRTGESGLEDPKSSSIREKKRSDLAARLRLSENCPDSVFVSIHQNKSPYTSAHGSVVYYSVRHPGGKLLAETLQKRIIDLLQPDNKRTVVAAGSNLFLLNHATHPAVLVECGFLSRAEEYQKLKNPAFQKAFCLVLADTISACYDEVCSATAASADSSSL